jgi:AcrR family transcriptional regulator
MKKRIVKDPEIRQTEILKAAEELFKNRGYVNTTVEAIIQEAGIAKGTFYYYFKSKEDILDALVHEMVNQLCEEYRKIAADSEMSAMDKMREMLRGQSKLSEKENGLTESLHRPENRELHERINIEIILRVAPILAQVVEQGKNESVFNVENPLQTIQFLLAGSQFLLESGLFKWNEEEQVRQALSLQAIIERSLGAAPGSFSFI